jgi:hypothetical protein
MELKKGFFCPHPSFRFWYGQKLTCDELLKNLFFAWLRLFPLNSNFFANLIQFFYAWRKVDAGKVVTASRVTSTDFGFESLKQSISISSISRYVLLHYIIYYYYIIICIIILYSSISRCAVIHTNNVSCNKSYAYCARQCNAILKKLQCGIISNFKCRKVVTNVVSSRMHSLNMAVIFCYVLATQLACVVKEARRLLCAYRKVCA